MDFSGKRVLVTGSTRGIGLATARAFLAHGAEVVVHGASQASVDRTKDELGVEHGIASDLASVEGCRNLIDGTLVALGGIDVLINNAALGDGAAFEKSDPAFWDRMMNVNLRAPFFCSQFALPALRASKGNIVMVSSVSGLMGHPEEASVYCTSKGGLINMTRVLALELAPDVRANCLAPGPIDTDMHSIPARQSGDPDGYYRGIDAWVPTGRIGTADEMANGILYLAWDGASFTTGAILSLDGGSGAGY